MVKKNPVTLSHYHLDLQSPPTYHESSGGKEFAFAVEGKPITKERPRFVNNHFFDPNKKAKQSLQLCIKKALRAAGVVEKPIFSPCKKHVSMVVEFQLVATGSRSADIDNLAKFVMDACNGLVYRDDIQVFDLKAVKIPRVKKTDPGRTNVRITSLESMRTTRDASKSNK
jgi:Holliday junction resolvase RusA-like endonuclease